MKRVETVITYQCDYCKKDLSDVANRVSVEKFDNQHFCKRCMFLFVLAAQSAIGFDWEQWVTKMRLVENKFNYKEDLR